VLRTALNPVLSFFYQVTYCQC